MTDVATSISTRMRPAASARGIAAVLLVLLLAPGCREKEKPKTALSSDPRPFVTRQLALAMSTSQLSAGAARRSRLQPVKVFAAALSQEQQQLVSSLTADARQRNAAIPDGIESRKIALRDNLAMLPLNQFDSAYLLAMQQDLSSAALDFRVSAKGGDPTAAALASRWADDLEARQKAAAALLNQLGGSPFNHQG